MKLFFILSEYLPDSGGGIISYYAGVLPHLVRAGHEVSVLVASAAHLDQPSTAVDGVQVAYLQSEYLASVKDGFARFSHGFPSFSAFLPIAWGAFQQARGGEGFDLVETTDYPMLYAPWVAESVHVPVNLSLHGSPGQLDWYERPGAPSIDGDWLRMIEVAALGSVYALQANSTANAAFWKARTQRDLPILPPAREAAPSNHGEAKRSSSGLVIGRLQGWKGPRVLCQAMRHLPELDVHWIGKDMPDPVSGDRFSDLLLREFPDIFGKRLQHEAPLPHSAALKRMAEAAFLCVPSTWDVFNLTAVEAMEMGTPVICSTAAGASMLIQHGENGYLFNPEQPAELADAIQSLLALNPSAREELIQQARDTVAEQLNPTALADSRSQYYHKLVKQWKPTQSSPWLQSVLGPRREGVEATELLRSFSSSQHAGAAVRQLVRGIQRRVGLPKSKVQ